MLAKQKADEALAKEMADLYESKYLGKEGQIYKYKYGDDVIEVSSPRDLPGAREDLLLSRGEISSQGNTKALFNALNEGIEDSKKLEVPVRSAARQKATVKPDVQAMKEADTSAVRAAESVGKPQKVSKTPMDAQSRMELIAQRHELLTERGLIKSRIASKLDETSTVDDWARVLDDEMPGSSFKDAMDMIDDTIDPDDLTLDFMGLQHVFNGIKNAAKKYRGRYSDDALHEVGADLANAYKGIFGKHVRQTASSALHKLARRRGFRLKKAGDGWRLEMRGAGARDIYAKQRGEIEAELNKLARQLRGARKIKDKAIVKQIKGEIKTLKDELRGLRSPSDIFARNLNEVNRILETGAKTADEYADSVNRVLWRDRSSEFLDFLAPQGIENISNKQLIKRTRKYLSYYKSRRRAFKPGDKWLRDAQYVLGRTPSSKKFYQKLRAARDLTENKTGERIEELLTVLEKYNINKKDEDMVRMLLDDFKGRDKLVAGASDNAKAAAKEVRSILNQTYKEAKRAGVRDIKEFRQNYFPHRSVDIDSLRHIGKKRSDMINAAVREGRFKDKDAAEKALDYFIEALDEKSIVGREGFWEKLGISESVWEQFIASNYRPESGHLVFSREVNLPWYNRELKTALSSYFLGANKSIVNAQTFGKGTRWANEMIARIRLEGGNGDIAKELSKAWFTPHLLDGIPKWQRKLMGYQVITKLNPFTTVLNYSQINAVALRTSTWDAVKGVHDYFTAGGKQFARESGAILNNTIADIMTAHGARGGWTTGYMRLIGFKKSEEILRTMAANAGKHYAHRLVKHLHTGSPGKVKYAKRQLDKLGVNWRRVGPNGLNGQQLKLIAKRVSDETQFRGDVFDMPIGATTPEGRLIFQYKTFAYNQAKLIKNHVIDEAKAGNIRPLMYLLSVYPAMGVTYDQVVNKYILGKDSKISDAFDWYWKGLTSVGALGIVFDLAQSAQYPGGLGNFLLGPSLSEIADIGHKLSTGKLDLKKELKQRVPVAGRLLKYRTD